MRRATNGLFKSLKDQVREVRYSIRAEAEAPGSTLPRILPAIGLRPLIAFGSPALRLADGLFAQVETIAAEVLKPVSRPEPAFPFGLGVLADRDRGLSSQLYEPFMAMLRSHGVRDMVVSEHVLDAAGEQFWRRHGDTFPHASDAAAVDVIRACAGLACALIEARPIRRVTYGQSGQARQNFMLSPNIYCGSMIGLATALVTLDPALLANGEAVLESVDSAVDARFPRFKRSLSGKAPAIDLAHDFEAILPFLP